MPEVLRREYVGGPTTPRAARGEIGAFLSGVARDDTIAIAVLVVTELVTNAVLYAPGVIELRATLTGTRLRIEVGDSSPELPSLREPGAGGRGLRIVEQLSDRWGVVTEDGPGKTAWCEISVA